MNPRSPEGCGGPDCGVFFKAFTGNVTDGPASVRLLQGFPATPGFLYTLEGWAGAEPNYLAQSVFNILFFDGGGNLNGDASLDITPGLFVANGHPFNYKLYSMPRIAPAGTVSVTVEVAMLNATNNPAGGGQAFVVDDFTFTSVPEPATLALIAFGVLGLIGFRRSR